MSFRAISPCLLIVAFSLPAAPGAVSISEDSTGISVRVEPSGRFTVEAASPGWVFSGDAGGPATEIASAAEWDSIGHYKELTFTYSVDGVARQGGIRTYSGKPAVLFVVKYLAGSKNTLPFPRFDTYPSNLSPFGFSAWDYSFGLDRIEPGSPWLLFDSARNALLLSPASDFIVSQIDRAGATIESGIDPAISDFHAGFEHRTMLVFGRGINAVFDTWGQALTDLYGKVRPASDADVSLARAGIWTDNRSPYYYQPGEAGQALIDARAYYESIGVRLGYVQADSWWYPKGVPPSWKNNGTGLYRLRADLSLFPDDLAGFRDRLGAPLVVHARYWHELSPDRSEYAFSGNVPIDPRYWNDLAAYLDRSGVAVFEQDWLSGPAFTDRNLADPDAFFDNMARAMAERGIHMQYCMPRPHHFLQGAKYSNLTSIRSSADGCARDRWDSFLFNSRLASALGIWPFTDNFLSTDSRNVLLATLSAGPFGPADEIGQASAVNLGRALRADGAIVKPDTPLVPTDATYLAIAQNAHAPMIAATSSGSGALKAFYVFAYARPDPGEAAFSPESLGVPAQLYPRSFVYDFFAQTGEAVNSAAEIRRTVDASGTYFVIVPIGPSGIAFLGDTSKFVSLGKKRISRLEDNGTITATVEFGEGDGSVTLDLFSPASLCASTAGGVVRMFQSGSDRQHYRVSVSSLGSPSVTVTIWPSGRSSDPRNRAFNRPFQLRSIQRRTEK